MKTDTVNSSAAPFKTEKDKAKEKPHATPHRVSLSPDKGQSGVRGK